MTTAAPALALLTALPPVGKHTASSAGAGAHKATQHAAEAGHSLAAPDTADTPEDSPSFAKLLRDQTAPEQLADSGTAAPNAAKADSPTEPADAPKATPQSSEELTAWLAALMRGPSEAKEQAKATVVATPDRSARNSDPRTTVPVSADSLPGLAAQTPFAKGATERSDARATKAKGAAAPAEKSAETDEKGTRVGQRAVAREPATAGLDGRPTALSAQTSASGLKQGAAAPSTAPEAPHAVKASAQRQGSADLNPSPVALAGMAPGTSAPSASSIAVVETAISQDIRRAEFVPAFSARIATLVQEGVEQARVHLNPVDMGPVSLQLSMDGLQVRVDMTAELMATRQVLEQALPTLAGALREAGFTLSGGGVSPPAESASANGQDTRGSGGSQGEPNPQASGQSTGLSGQQADGRRPPDTSPGRTLSTGGSMIAEGLTTELHLDAEGRPSLTPGRGLVDTFA